MKAEYICEVCGKKYSNPDEAIKCEENDIIAKQEQEIKDAEKENEALEIRKLYNAYVKKYGETPFRIPPTEYKAILNSFFPLF